MRIGMLTTGYPHQGDPVSGAFVREMARALVARGHCVRVLCAEARKGEPLRDRGVDVVPVRYAPHRALGVTFYGAGAPDALVRGAPLAWLGAASFPIALARAARRELARCEALVSHFVLPCGAVAGALRAGRPHLSIAHGTDALIFARAPAAVQRAVLAGTTALQVTHSALRDALAPGVRDDSRVSVGPMGYVPCATLDAAERARLREELGVSSAELLVLAVARLVPVKGLDVLVEAAALLARQGVRVRVLIAGEGPERQRLERAARQASAPVRMLGVVDAGRRDALLGVSDAFVLPSLPLPDGRTEAAPVSLLEAMGAGLSVVASDVGGVREIAGDAVRLVPPGDARALAHELAELARDEGARAALGARAHERALPHRWERVAERIERTLAQGS